MSLSTGVTRPFSLQTKVPGCELHVRSFTGEEAVSRLFQFRVVAHADAHVPVEALLGQSVTFAMAPRAAPERRFLALIASVDELGADDHHRPLYALELVPRLWAMTRTIQARVFTDANALGILDKVFEGSGIRVQDETLKAAPVRPYCVQYFESDFDFAARLLEEEGYIYQYEAQGEKPVFTVRELPSPCQRAGPVFFRDVTGGPEERIASWKKTRILAATTVNARDHLFETESALLTATARLPENRIPGWEPLAAGWSASIDRYPGQWAHLFEEVQRGGGAGDLDGYVAAGGLRAQHDLYQTAGWTSGSEGEGNCPRLVPGAVFDLVGHSTSAGAHFVVSVRHEGSQALDHSSRGAPGFDYQNRFTCVPHEAITLWRPPRSTRKPVIHGCQTARVRGASGVSDIWTDKYGRVQVQFWWQTGEEPPASCWVRVATPWAGSNWGIQHIPRVGQEVVVAFLDGDPDRPLIVGSVYNKQQMPPFDLPGEKTRSGIRTRSTEGGGAGESNELRFEDARGKEEVYLHARKDRTAVVRNESREVVGGDRFDVVGNDFHATTCGEKRESIGGASSLTVSGDAMNEVLGKLGMHAREIHLKADRIVIEAGSISLRTGDKKAHFICLEGDGITIDSKGKQVWLNCGGRGEPEDGCFTAPRAPEEPFESIDPEEPDFGKLDT